MTKLYLHAFRYLTVLLMFGALSAAAQQTVTGKVNSSDDGSGIPGVNVLEKGTTNGTVTDANGAYKIAVGSDATLIFSFVGYATQSVVVGAQTTVDVALVADVTALSEVLVVGYGSQQKKEITGAVAQLDQKDFNKGTVNDPTMLMQGKVAGLSIYNKGGDPNASPVVRLRGLSSVGANASPLVVVDGVLGASLDNIDPNDIESINVLKDGSAAAIYGSRGSSGVILVTTKKGNRGGLGVSFNSSIAAATVYKKIPVMSASEYVANGGNNLGSDTDWQKQVTQTGVTAVNNLAVSGGDKNTQFRLSMNLRDVNGVLKKSGFDQINTRANLTHTALGGRLKIDFNMAFTTRKYNNSFPEALRYAALYNPTAPIYFPGSTNYYQAILFDNYNPVAILQQNVNEGRRKNLNFGAKVDYEIIKNLTVSVNFGQQYDSDLRSEYYPSTSLFRGYNRNGLARRYSSDKNFTLLEGYATYAKNLGKLDLSVTGGYSYQEDQFTDYFVETGNFPSDQLGYNALGSSGDLLGGIAGSNGINLTSSKTPVNKIIAFFGRVNMTWDNGIFFNASVRQEGSTKLGADHRWGTFPALGAGVDLNHYLELPKFSLLKLRVGYGVTGSLPATAGLSQDAWTYAFTNGGAVTHTQLANPDLKWEKKAETNIGLDFAVGKFNGAIEVYNRTISDFILPFVPDAVNNPGTSQYKNAGSLNTPGIELTLGYNAVQIGQVSWTPGLVLSHYKTTLKSFIIDRSVRADFGAPGQNGTNVAIVQVGQPIGQLWGPVFDHVSTGAAGDGGISAGAPVFKDLNGDGVIDSAPADALNPKADMKVLGSGIPSAEVGWSNRITFKNWDFNVFFRGAFGHSLLNQFRGFYEPIDPGAINSYNRVTTSKAPAGLTSAQYSSLYVEKADFLKLDNVTVGYNFKLNGGIKSLRLYVSGQNLFVITKYTGIDPEPVLQDYGSTDNGAFQSTTPDPLVAGIDRRNNYFTMRTFTFGLNLGF